jgi:hypothetical protein
MARCPLCRERSAKRFCPAKQTTICAVCCGTKREVEIDCPSSCIHLQSGRSYESERKPLDPQLVARARSYSQSFLEQYAPVLEALGAALAEERMASPWLVDQDAADVYTALLATMKTLSSGIYYETLPEGPARLPLFRRLKSVLDSLLTPSDAQQRVLRTSEVVSVLDFLLLSVRLNSSARPKSRQYLDWITNMSGLTAPPPESSRLIIP